MTALIGFPFRSGISGEPYSEAPWIIGQYSGFSHPAHTNARFREMIKAGQTGLAIALDLPTQHGLDSDHPLARGEVGRVGVSVTTLDDLETMFDGIALDEIRQVSTTANSIGPMMVALFLALAQRRGVDPNRFSVRLQNDVLKEYVARGTYVFPPAIGVRLATDAVEYCVKHLPSWVPMSISGYHMRDAGASRVQELAFTLANAREYLNRAGERGIDPADFARQVTWFLSASPEPLDEAAKFRAAREIWARTLREDFGVEDEDALRLRIIAYTLGGALAPTEIMNNAVRVTLAALGAMLGGVQTIFCSSIDEALGLPAEECARLAIRTQQILLKESGIARWIDPVGGAEAIEELTDSLISDVLELERDVQEQGGAVAAIASGWMRSQIEESSWERHVAEEAVRVGDVTSDPRVQLFQFDPEWERERVDAFSAQRARQANGSERRAHIIADAVDRGDNLVAPLVQVFLAGGSIGEVFSVLARSWDSHLDL